MKKKFVWLLFALLLLSACGGDADPASQPEEAAQAAQITVYKSPT